MSYLGDFAVGATVYCAFNTRDTDGAPITLAGTPAVSVYKDADDTQDTSGVTLAVDDDSVTGFHRVSIDTSQDGTFFAAGGEFQIVITTGTVDSVSVVGVVVGTFSLERAGGALALLKSATFGLSAIETLVDGLETTIGAAGAGLTALATQASVDTIDNFLDTEVAAILEDTGTTLPATLATIAGYLDTEIAAIKAVTDNLPDSGALTSLATAANLATVDTVVDAIKVKTDSLTFTTANRVDASARDVSGSTAATTALARSAASMVVGTCDAGGTTTSVVASALTPTSAVADQFNGRYIIFAADTTTTALRGQATDITDYDHDTLTFTVTALTTAPSSGDTFVVV